MLIAFNKPYGVLCQFSDTGQRPTLADFIDLPGVYAAGRLDRDSEGLLLLTDDGNLQHQLTDPRHRTAKTYHVQVEGVASRPALDRLRRRVVLSDGPTRPAEVELLARQPGYLWKRDPPIRQRRKIPTSWLAVTLTEGRNRQVRRMTAAVGLPTLRLIRHRIGNLTVEGLQPGEWREVEVAAVG